jgi:o-succinylbenzoate synthase
LTTVRNIRLSEIRLPLREPFRISSGEVHERRILLVAMEDTDGFRSWSECVAGEQPNYSPETIDTAWFAIVHWLAPRLIGVPVPGPEAINALLRPGIQGHRMAMAALEMGYWVLEAERRGLSLSRLIGGTRDRVLTGISLGIQATPDRLVEQASAAIEAGYRKVKIKIGPGRDIEYIAAVREALGESAPLMADANNAYELDDADHLARLDAFGLLMIEQPLDADDLVRHAELQKRLTTPICLDESITSLRRAQDMVRLGSGRIINIKPGRVGGFAESKAIHDFAEAMGMPVWCGGMLESGIGRAYNVALASLPGFVIPGDISPSARYWARDIVTPEWTMDDGRMTVPVERPGLGVDIDIDRVDDLTVRREQINA